MSSGESHFCLDRGLFHVVTTGGTSISLKKVRNTCNALQRRGIPVRAVSQAASLTKLLKERSDAVDIISEGMNCGF